MQYHLRLCKAFSYTGIVSATEKKPDVYVDDKSVAEAAVATGYFELIADKGLSAPEKKHLDRRQLEEMTVDNLKGLAADMGIDTTRLKKKSEYVEAISAVEVEPGEEISAEGENEADFGDDGKED